MVGNLREFSVPWKGKDLGATLKRASEVAGGNLGNGGAAAGDVGAPPVITAVLVRPRVLVESARCLSPVRSFSALVHICAAIPPIVHD